MNFKNCHFCVIAYTTCINSTCSCIAYYNKNESKHVLMDIHTIFLKNKELWGEENSLELKNTQGLEGSILPYEDCTSLWKKGK